MVAAISCGFTALPVFSEGVWTFGNAGGFRRIPASVRSGSMKSTIYRRFAGTADVSERQCYRP
jgi:hypothetical protein